MTGADLKAKIDSVVALAESATSGLGYPALTADIELAKTVLESKPAILDIAAAALTLLIAYETWVYGEARQRVRHPDTA